MISGADDYENVDPNRQGAAAARLETPDKGFERSIGQCINKFVESEEVRAMQESVRGRQDGCEEADYCLSVEEITPK